MKKFLLFLFFIFNNYSFSQNKTSQKWNNENHSLKNNALNSLVIDSLLVKAENFLSSDIDSATYYRMKIEKLIVQKNGKYTIQLELLKIKEAIFTNRLQAASMKINNFKKKYYDKCAVEDKLKFKYIEIMFFEYNAEFKQGLIAIDDVLKNYGYLNTNIIGDIYFTKSNFFNNANTLQAAQDLNKALEIYILHDNDKGILKAKMGLFYQYIDLKEYDQAFNCIQEVIKSDKLKKSRIEIIDEQCALGLVLYHKGEYQKAVKVYDYVLNQNKFTKLIDVAFLGFYYKNLSLYELGYYQRVIDNCNLEIKKPYEEFYMFTPYFLLIKSYNKQKKFAQAKIYIAKIDTIIEVEIKRVLPVKDELEFLQACIETEKGLGNAEKALQISSEYIASYAAYYDNLNINIISKTLSDFKNKESKLELKDLKIKSQDDQLTILKTKNKNNVFRAVILFGFLLISITVIAIVKINSRNNKLEQQNKIIQQQYNEINNANITLQKTFSIISHDLRNPFNALLGYSTLLVNNFDKYSDAKKMDQLKMIRSAAEINYNLTQNLLSWSLKQHRGYAISKSKQNLQHVVEQVVAQLSAVSELKDLLVEINIPDKMVFIDGEIVSIILNNLLTNAITFSSKNGIIIISSSLTESQLCISVFNNSLVLADNKLKKIIDYLTSALSDDDPRVGFGLQIAKEMALLHNGYIEFRSENGATEVTVHINLYK